MIKAIIQHIESIRKGVTLKIDIDDAKRPDDMATWQDEEVILTNGREIVTGILWKIQTTMDECVQLSVKIPRYEYPDDIFTWKHEQILIKKENEENGKCAETDRSGKNRKRKRA